MGNVNNSVSLMGFAGSDLVIIELENQKRLARVSIAVNEYFKNSAGEAFNQTQWFNLVFWNKKIDLVENMIKKGVLFKVEGKLNTQTYTDKNGLIRQTIEIVVNKVDFMGKEDAKLITAVE